MHKYLKVSAMATLPLLSLLAAPPASKVDRGRYLAEQVAMCGDCHTPHGPQGPVVEQSMAGAALPFQPTVRMPAWSSYAPPLAGLPKGWSEAEMIAFLKTGLLPSGKPARPPMPPYRLSEEDATAVTAYLKSLRSK